MYVLKTNLHLSCHDIDYLFIPHAIVHIRGDK